MDLWKPKSEYLQNLLGIKEIQFVASIVMSINSFVTWIQPAELRRMEATLSLAYRGSLDPDHILYGLLSGSSDTRQVRLRSRRPFVPGARYLLDNFARLGIRSSEWTNKKMENGVL